MTKVTHLTLDERGELSRRRIHLREISGDADSPLETVGQDLRAARLRRGDDLASVSRVLRIRKDHLEAIEEDRLESLPGRTYAVGFVRSYADYLGLDPVQVVGRFKSEIAGRSDGSPQVGLPPDVGGSRLPHGWMIMAVVVLGVVIYGAYLLARSADRLTTQSVASVPAAMVTARSGQQAPGRHAARPPASQTSAAENANGTGVPGSKPGTLPASPAAAAALGRADSTTANTVPNGQVFGTQNRNVRIVLHIHALTRLLVEGPAGRVFINRVLHPGDLYRVPDLVGLLLTTQDGGAVSVELDGQDMGVAGKTGQVTEGLPLDPQAIVDRRDRGRPG